MSKMSMPEVEVIRFGGGTDIIATSGVTISNVGDNTLHNAELSFTFNGVTKSYGRSFTELADFRDDVNAAYGSSFGSSADIMFYATDGTGISHSNSIWRIVGEASANDAVDNKRDIPFFSFWNGLFSWNGSGFEKQ